ncbi:hypothetical protein HXA31_20365 [Salipaludibacillus agaradhaerens]|jgi:RNase P/RNase MRP subunit p30|uniref:Uncharacterized protein n=1 Tax=Salipaludibacillus agaradhaerens TaxID=76935 RepID=A0A9Q4FZ83_SALAG|nr:hypothetical protein [Salipaludibacillus agaradhaerens]MCR6096842.1 hypothetical protein [Salipaludibacillus agaradhaerens]MCR6116686.1 hypothetical protein [Salipaludibacillus agaradhaerens]
MGEDMHDYKISELAKDVSEIKVDLKDYQKDDQKWKRNMEERSFQNETRIHMVEKNMEDVKGLLKVIRNCVITILVGGILTLLFNLPT